MARVGLQRQKINTITDRDINLVLKVSCGCNLWPTHCTEQKLRKSVAKIGMCTSMKGGRGGTVVKVLCYKSEGRWFDSR